MTCELNATVSARWVVLDIVPGGLLGFIPIVIDAFTGEWKSLDSDYCNVTLPQIGGDNYFEEF